MRFERNSDTNKHVLHHDGFTYDLDSKADGKQYWRCQHKGCDGLAVSKIGKGKRNGNADLTVGHNHSTSFPECSKCKKLSLPELRLESGTMKCGLPACETYIHPSCGKALRGYQGKRYVFCGKRHRSNFVKRIEPFTEEEDKSNTSERETYPEASDGGEGSVNENSDADQRSDGSDQMLQERPKKKVQQDKEKSAFASSSEADLPSLDDRDNLEDDHDKDMEDDDDLPTLPDWMRESAEQHEEENGYAAASCSSISVSDKKSKRPKATDAGATIGKQIANLLKADAFHPDGNHSGTESLQTRRRKKESANVPSASRSNVPSASRSNVPSASRSDVSESDSDTPLVQNGAGPSASGLTATSSQQPTGAKRPRTQSPTCENGLREEEDNDPKTDLTSEYLRSKIRKNNLISDKTQREITLLKEKELQEELTRRKTQKEMEMLDEKRRREEREHELIVEKMQREIELIKKRCEREAEKTEKDKEMCRRAEEMSRREEEESRVRRDWYVSNTHNQ
ncbi:hypothetical protein ACOMHN_046188 [Nucella lapillus]